MSVCRSVCPSVGTYTFVKIVKSIGKSLFFECPCTYIACPSIYWSVPPLFCLSVHYSVNRSVHPSIHVCSHIIKIGIWWFNSMDTDNIHRRKKLLERKLHRCSYELLSAETERAYLNACFQPQIC